MSSSPQGERLALAAEYAPRLLATGAKAVAVTGSVGRGDADAGSDLDLWVIAADEGVDHDIVASVPITVMRESEARVLDLEHLARVEVDSTRVIADPDGIFARVFAHYAEHVDQLRAWNLADAEARLGELRATAQHGTPEGRLWALRAAAHLACATRLYEQTGMLTPKMRHFRARLDGDSYALLRRIHGIDDVAPHVAGLIDMSAQIAELMTAELRRLPASSRSIAPPHNGLLKLVRGDLDDGVLALRNFFETSFVDQVVAALPEISMVRYLRDVCDPDIRSYWRVLHGLDDATPSKLVPVQHDLVTLLRNTGRPAAAANARARACP